MRIAAGFFALLLLFSCSDDAPTGTPSQLEGTITEVEVEDDLVTAFEIETADGEETVLIDPERDYGFDLLHLEEHAETGDPVLVDVESDDGDLVAVTIEDV